MVDAPAIVSAFEAVGSFCAGRMQEADLLEVERRACPGAGSCGGVASQPFSASCTARDQGTSSGRTSPSGRKSVMPKVTTGAAAVTVMTTVL